MGMFKEFRDFAMRGNVVDLAIGIVVGGAFSKIVTSLVNDVIMPPIGVLLGKVDFSNLALPLLRNEKGEVTAALRFGAFINTIVDFAIVAFAIFIVVKAINAVHKSKAAAPPPTKDQELLAEIRDLLKAAKTP